MNSSDFDPLKKFTYFLYNLPTSVGWALLLVSPYYLERLNSDAYFAFGILENFIPFHLLSISALAIGISLVMLLIGQSKLPSNWLKAFIFGVFSILFFRAILLTTGFSPQSLAITLQRWLSYFWQDSLSLVAIKNAGGAVIVAICYLLFTKFNPNLMRFLRACAALGWILGLITALRIIPLVAADNEFLKVRQQLLKLQPTSKIAEKRVIWIIFDELDYSRLTTKRNPNLALPNLDLLESKSVIAKNATSPAWATSISIPALITGTYLIGTTPTGPGKLLLHTKAGDNIEWGNASSIFSQLHAKEKKIAILGFYHPYCNIFPYVNPCFSQSILFNPTWWWGIWQGLRTIPGVANVLREYDWTNQDYNLATQLQLNAINNYISNKDNSLTFIHMNIPHMPGHRVSDAQLPKNYKTLPGYEINLLTVDWVIGGIVQNLETQAKYQDILLIVSSDHWLRTNLFSTMASPSQFEWEFGKNPEEVHKIPLFIRRIRESSHYIISSPINTIHTSKLIEDFLSGKIDNHASIAKWWLKKSHPEPITQDNLEIK